MLFKKPLKVPPQFAAKLTDNLKAEIYVLLKKGFDKATIANSLICPEEYVTEVYNQALTIENQINAKLSADNSILIADLAAGLDMETLTGIINPDDLIDDVVGFSGSADFTEYKATFNQASSE